MKLLGCIYAILLASIPVYTQGQLIDYREETRADDGSGITRGVHQFMDGQSSMRVSFVEILLPHATVTVTGAVSGQGPHLSLPLSELAASPAGEAALAFVPNQGKSPLGGMLIVEGGIYAWPPIGEHLSLSPEGNAVIREFEPSAASLVFPDGFTHPILSLNQSIPTNPGEMALFTGELSPRQLPMIRWPEDLVGSVIEGSSAGDVHQLLMKEEPFTGGIIQQQRQLRTTADQGLLIFKPPVPEELSDRLRRGDPFNLRMGIPEKAKLAKMVIPVQDFVMRNGAILDETWAIRNAVAIDASGLRMMWLSTGAADRRQRATTLAGLSEFLTEGRYTDVITLSEDMPLLISDLNGSEISEPASRVPTNLALIVSKERKRLRMRDEAEGDLVRLAPNIVSGNDRGSVFNKPGAVVDQRIGFDPHADQFWSAPSPSDRPAELRFLFSEPQEISVIELIHAESTGFSPEFNLKGYEVLAREDSGDPWRALVVVNRESPAPRDRHMIETMKCRELILRVTEPNFLSGKTARLSEIIFWGSP